nr:DUF3016 domain-containing protein [Variovorax boronicumulans]
MTAMPSRWALLIATALLVACAAPRPTGAPPGAVSVSWSDPARFSEARENRRETPAAREAWLSALARHLAEKAAAVLPMDEKLEVRITDVQRAGGFEPWRGPQAGEVRIVRDIYPPRITLEFKQLAADGRVVKQGRRDLRDAGFLMRPALYPSDPLGHEKVLLDDWVRREFSRSAPQ